MGLKGYARTEPVRLYLWLGTVVAAVLAALKMAATGASVINDVIAGLEVLVPILGVTEAARATAWSPASVEAMKPTEITPEVAGSIGMPTPPPEPEAPPARRRKRGENGAIEPAVLLTIALLVALAIWVRSIVAVAGAVVLTVLVLLEAHRRPPRY